MSSEYVVYAKHILPEGSPNQSLCPHELPEIPSGKYKIDVSLILFSQDNIHNRFGDGTTLEDGIQNVRENKVYPIKGDVLPGGARFVTINNRTLYCYQQGGVKTVVFTVVRGLFEQKKRAFLAVPSCKIREKEENRNNKKDHKYSTHS